MTDHRRISTLLNQRILDCSGEFVGRVCEILFDAKEGRIEYICIALLDDQEDVNLVAQIVVPWSAIELEVDRSLRWHVAAHKSTLRSLDKGWRRDSTSTE